MKRILIIFIVFYLTLLTLEAKKITANLVQGTYGPSTTVVFAADNAKLMVSTETLSDGTVSLKTPPFFSVELDPYLYFGEIKPSGIVRQAISPDDISFSYTGFFNTRFERVNTPSLTPTYSGLAIPFGNFDIFAFNPAFYPSSPLAFGLDWGNEKVFTCLVLSDSKKEVDKTSENYQINWKENLGDFKSVKLLLGAVSHFSIKKLRFRAQSFINITDDLICGRALYEGLDLKIQLKSFHFLLRKRLSQKADKSLVEFKIGDSLKLSFTDKIYSQPIYGGLYQERDTSFTTTVKKGNLEFSNEAVSSISKTGKKNLKENIDLEYKVKKNSLTLYTVLDIDSDGLEFSSWKISAKYKIMKLSFSENKTQLSYTFTKEISEKCKAELTIDQDRKLSVTCTYKD